ncbi:MAG: hypothetical protein IKE63_05730 [Bacilli bacterium]|nr:hypothetical protein [Bacilli bacterium]
MEKYMNSNKFGAISLGLIIITIIMIVIWLLTINGVVFVLGTITLITAIPLTIIGLFKDNKKLLSVISLSIAIVIIVAILFFLFVLLPLAVNDAVEGMQNAWGIGSN